MLNLISRTRLPSTFLHLSQHTSRTDSISIAMDSSSPIHDVWTQIKEWNDFSQGSARTEQRKVGVTKVKPRGYARWLSSNAVGPESNTSLCFDGGVGGAENESGLFARWYRASIAAEWPPMSAKCSSGFLLSYFLPWLLNRNAVLGLLFTESPKSFRNCKQDLDALVLSRCSSQRPRFEILLLAIICWVQARTGQANI